jgi:SpoVK/Ycf46/Vps4 family AAA+-type ATPase
MNSKRFIDYLDTYNDKTQYNYSQYSLLTGAIQSNFIENHLNDISFVGNINIKNPTKNQPVFLHFYPILENPIQENPIQENSIQESSSNFYSKYSGSIWNTLNQSRIAETQYSIWQKEHETNIYMPALPPTITKTKQKTIDASINTLSDVIKIIDENDYDDETEYNIDLKSLHNIKAELKELNEMIGMDSIKQSILNQLIYFIQELHMGNNTSDFKHTVLYGPPGTGKTEIAKIIGKMYSKIGILKSNVFKKVTRNDLIAGYLGQTAIKTRKVIDECLGGVLFIDEAYSLANSGDNDSYSKECIDILCEALSNHKNDLMVIIAGYEEELKETFFKVNKGMYSRFIWRFNVDSYNPKQLMNIFKKKIIEQEWSLENENDLTEKWFEDKKDNFKHYGRDMELLLTYVKVSHGRRIYGKPVEFKKKITLGDMNDGYSTFKANKKNKKENNFIHSIYI